MDNADKARAAFLTHLRAGSEVAELTGMVDLTGCPDGTRVIVRRERPHPGAQLALFDLDEGMRHQAFLTDTPDGEGSLPSVYRRHSCALRLLRSGIRGLPLEHQDRGVVAE